MQNQSVGRFVQQGGICPLDVSSQDICRRTFCPIGRGLSVGCFVLGHLSYRMFCQYDDLSVHLYSKIGAYRYSMKPRPELALSTDVYFIHHKTIQQDTSLNVSVNTKRSKIYQYCRIRRRHFDRIKSLNFSQHGLLYCTMYIRWGTCPPLQTPLFAR